MATTGPQTETDALSHLEDRIQRAVALVQRLRLENEVALKELTATQTALEDSVAPLLSRRKKSSPCALNDSRCAVVSKN